MKKYSAKEFNEMKKRIKAEVARRNNNGDISQYAGRDYDYTSNPAKNGEIKLEHVNKIITPLNAINNNLTEKQKGDTYIDPNVLDAKISIYESKEMTSSNTGCNASCTGLCSAGCSGTCTGCSGGCEGTCTGTCSGGCSGGCSGCGSGCSGGCSGCGSGCSGGCSGCSGGCSGCSDSCSSSCGGGCYKSCTGSCIGCASDCSDSCAYGCNLGSSSGVGCGGCGGECGASCEGCFATCGAGCGSVSSNPHRISVIDKLELLRNGVSLDEIFKL